MKTALCSTGKEDNVSAISEGYSIGYENITATGDWNPCKKIYLFGKLRENYHVTGTALEKYKI